MASTRSCIICDSKKFDPYGQLLIKCRKCGLVVAKKIPTPAEIQKLYQQEYFFGKEYSNYEVDRPALEHNFKKRIKGLARHLHKKAYVVELGSAYGYFLNLIQDDIAKHIGFEISHEGVEYSKKSLKLNATNADFMKHKFKPGEVDIVVMWDVVEHLIHPEQYIERIAQILKTGGRVALTTGDIGTPLPRARKDKWRMIHPPTHVYYFSKSTITQLLEKYGFEVERVRYPSVSRNFGSVANQILLNRKAQGKSTKVLAAGHKLAEKTRLTSLNIPLNTWDIMEVVAVKKARSSK